MEKKDKRSSYWDSNYFEYWKAKVTESRSKNDKNINPLVLTRTPNDEVYSKLINENFSNLGTLLDVGCGWGRLFDFYKMKNADIYGIDISKKMIDEAKINYPNLVNNLKVSQSESLPYEDNFFDSVVCIGTFDCTYQEETFFEMMRVLKINGRLLVTGKSIKYRSDDIEATKAEIGAKSKGHPNYFTDTDSLVTQILASGQKIIGTYFFHRRGDFTNFVYDSKSPDNFYEYCFVIKKMKNPTKFFRFSYKNSYTDMIDK